MGTDPHNVLAIVVYSPWPPLPLHLATSTSVSRYGREWISAYLVDSEDDSVASTAIQLSYSCINEASDSHTVGQIVS